MARECTVCASVDRHEIDLHIRRGTPLRRLGTEFQLSEASLRRHAANHLPEEQAVAGDADDRSDPNAVTRRIADEHQRLSMQLIDLDFRRSQLSLDVVSDQSLLTALREVESAIADVRVGIDRLALANVEVDRRSLAEIEQQRAAERDQMQAEFAALSAQLDEHYRAVETALDTLAPAVDAALYLARQHYALGRRLGEHVQWDLKARIARRVHSRLASLAPEVAYVPPMLRGPLVDVNVDDATGASTGDMIATHTHATDDMATVTADRTGDDR